MSQFPAIWWDASDIIISYRQIWLNILVRLLPLEQDNKIKEQNTPECYYAMFFFSIFCCSITNKHAKKDLALNDNLFLEPAQKPSIYSLATYSSQQ